MTTATRPIPDAARLAELREWAEYKHEHETIGGDGHLASRWLDVLALIDLAEKREWHDPDMVRPTEYRDLDVEIELSNGLIVIGKYCGDGLWKDTDGRGFWHDEVRHWRELPR